jgi:hypothetical protein
LLTAVGARELLAYSSGELDAAADARDRGTFFDCAECARRLEGLQALGGGVAKLLARGELAAGASVALLERARAAGCASASTG